MPTAPAPNGGSPAAAAAAVAIAAVMTVWSGAAQHELAVLAAEPGDVDLDADLEQQQHDADVGEQHELVVVGDVARRERRHRQPHDEVADDRRQP